MDRIQPVEVHGIPRVEAFVEPKDKLHLESQSKSPNLEKIKPSNEIKKMDEENGDMNDREYELGLVETIDTSVENRSKIPISQNIKPPRITHIADAVDAIHTMPLPSFESLTHISRFIMNYTGSASCRIYTPSDVVMYKCHFPTNTYWEGCHPEILEKITEICEHRNGKLVMQLRYFTSPCHSCIEEETNTIDILGPDERLMATIIQKKTWQGARINREILIQPGPYGKSDSYSAQFSWNDASINFKANQKGIVVATLMTDCKEKGKESCYVLQFLRDIRPRDKAILIAFMIARDTLLMDESQTKEVAERVAMVLVILGFIAILSYFFLPSRH